HIADYVFELKATYAGAPRRGSQITVHAETVHPVTRMPIAGVEWEAMLSIEDQGLAPSRVSNHDEGFVDFTFDLPAVTNDQPDEEGTVEISARRGDFEQDVSVSMRIHTRLSGRFQSDKPIYQPGQTIHLRAVVLDAQGRAAQGAKVTLRIDDQDNERVHTAQLVSSKFGVVQDEWLVPDTASLGSYQIALTAEGDNDYQIARHAA